MPAEQLLKYCGLLTEINAELRQMRPDSEHLIRSLLYYLLLALNRSYADRNQLPLAKPENHYAYHFKHLLEQHITEKQRVAEYAALLGISRITLNKAVQAQLNVTAMHLLKYRLLFEIKNALLHSERPVTEIAPMLSTKGTIESWGGVERNPTVELKMPVAEIIQNLDLVMVTHTHADHFDEAASKALDESIELINQPADQEFFQKQGFANAKTLADGQEWHGIQIHRLEAEHGSGDVLKMMGKPSGFVLQAKNQPTVYTVGDAIWTDKIKQNITKCKPDYIIVNSGGARIAGFENTPILMDEEKIILLVMSYLLIELPE